MCVCIMILKEILQEIQEPPSQSVHALCKKVFCNPCSHLYTYICAYTVRGPLSVGECLL